MTEVTSAKDRIAGAILAGGQAVRYDGRPKGLLEAATGLSIIEQEIRQLNLAGIDEVIIVASDPEPWRNCALKTVLDLRPGLGPLAGIEAALTYYGQSHDATSFLPCDLPGITTNEISCLQAAFTDNSALVAVAVTSDFLCEPLCTIVHNDLRKTARPLRTVSAAPRNCGAIWGRLQSTLRMRPHSSIEAAMRVGGYAGAYGGPAGLQGPGGPAALAACWSTG